MKFLANWVSRAMFLSVGAAMIAVVAWFVMPPAPAKDYHPLEAVPRFKTGPSIRDVVEANGKSFADTVGYED